MPEPLDFGYERELDSHALCFTVRDNDGHVVAEVVAMLEGGMFDLFARPLPPIRPSTRRLTPPELRPSEGERLDVFN